MEGLRLSDKNKKGGVTIKKNQKTSYYYLTDFDCLT